MDTKAVAASTAATSSAAVLSQTTDSVLLIRPAAFGVNPQTAASNSFQSSSASAGDGSSGQSVEAARRESDALAAVLQANGVTVHHIEDTPTPIKVIRVFARSMD